MDLRAVRGLWVRARAGFLANLGLKLVALVFALLIHVYVVEHRPGGAPLLPSPPAACPP